MIKCPICNSTRITEGLEGMKCQRCGWINNSKVKIIKSKTGNKVENEWMI
jgi:RNA polymerase subunit RPABC4/transcription elongation factor Spt4